MTNFRLLCHGGLPSPLFQLVAHRPAGKQAPAAKFPCLRERNKVRGAECPSPGAISLRRVIRFHISTQIHKVLETMRAGSTFPDRLRRRPRRRERRGGPKAQRRIFAVQKRQWIRRSEVESCGETSL